MEVEPENYQNGRSGIGGLGSPAVVLRALVKVGGGFSKYAGPEEYSTLSAKTDTRIHVSLQETSVS